MAFKIRFGMGKTEVAKAAKGAGIAGSGAVLATALTELGILPDVLMAPPLGPYVVAALAVAINLARQLIKDNNADEQ